MRRLPIPIPAVPARLSPTCPTIPLTSRLQSQASALNKPQNRPFSHTTPLSNSPFRLSSTPSTPQATYQPPGPSNPFSEPNFGPATEKDYSPYPPRRQWPPDMSKLSPKHQFRLERKYRRRAALKYARPKWVKATMLVQWGAIGFVLIYALLFMEWDDRGGNPLEDFRTYIFGTLKGAFSSAPPPSSMRRSEESESAQASSENK